MNFSKKISAEKADKKLKELGYKEIILDRKNDYLFVKDNVALNSNVSYAIKFFNEINSISLEELYFNAWNNTTFVDNAIYMSYEEIKAIYDKIISLKK